ncbi:glycosyltransferase [Pantoea anthophila]|uniref:glycosyltransferase n=1 Tax=Pantoea anthophila TaxID=470931 RepID=UPI0027821E9E|nr:glycosyltransferase [Pantoea anthophila]MDQ1214957.1 glycosyltransferase involved in cell wall biosynthesis [Pantoea anthophila]
MRVLHAAETIKGGVATVLDSLATFQKQNHQISQLNILVPEQHMSELSATLRPYITTFNRQKRGVLGLLSFAKSFYRQVKSLEPNIVHLHSTFAGFIGRLMILAFFRNRNIKVVYCPHGFSFLVDTFFIKRLIFTLCERLLSLSTQSIICVGEFEYIKALEKGFSSHKLCLISNGVELPSLSNALTHNKLDEYTLLYVGRFDYQKGTDTLMDALRTLDEKTLSFKLNVIMVGSSVNQISDKENYEFKNITITYTGWIKKEQIGEYYRKANCLIIPSRWEGFAMVPLEAISYNLPIITSDIVAFKELNRVSKLFFNCGNSASLASLLSGINTYDLDNAKKRLMQKLVDNYTRDKMNTKTLDVYAQVTTRKIK